MFELTPEIKEFCNKAAKAFADYCWDLEEYKLYPEDRVVVGKGETYEGTKFKVGLNVAVNPALAEEGLMNAIKHLCAMYKKKIML